MREFRSFEECKRGGQALGKESETVVDHQCFTYRDKRLYLSMLTKFLANELACGNPLLLALPRKQLRMLTGFLPPGSPPIKVIDMTKFGKNPGRVIAALTEHLESLQGGAGRLIIEFDWENRSSAETDEIVKHEALINVASAEPTKILCLMDARQVLVDRHADFVSAHPYLYGPAGVSVNKDYERVGEDILERWSLRDPCVGASVSTLTFTNPESVRSFVRLKAREFGLGIGMKEDLVLCADELANNSCKFGEGGGTIRLWEDEEGRVVCEVFDEGVMTDPLAGRYPPDFEKGATGLWIVNQLCDLVQIRSSPQGTTIRITVSA